MNTIIEKIRAEIERRKKRYQKDESGYGDGAFCEDVAILSFLSDLEKEEKPTIQEQPVDLEKEIKEEKLKWRFFDEIGFASAYDYRQFDGRDIDRIARHFYELGQQSKQKVSEGLEEEIKSFALNFYQDNGNLPMVADIARHFAQWQADKDLGKISRAYENGATFGMKLEKEKMMKEAVEVRVQTSPLNGPLGISAYCCNFPSKHPFYHCKEGDKVRIIIVKED